MVNRIPVSLPEPIYFDAMDVDNTDLTLQQIYNDQITAGIKSNHFGSGVLPNSLIQRVLFDSETTVGLLDGKALNAQAQPSDNNLGNQLEISLSGSMVAGNRTVKILIIGLDFQQNLQYDAVIFHRNETQFTSKHYTAILTILFNDLTGISTQSFNLGGRVLIKEANPLTLSRDCVMISQSTAPNLFFRDFFVSVGGTLSNVLTAALPSYNINTLNIQTSYIQLAQILENDVSSQIGQKSLATTNNIQKITLLISVNNTITPNDFLWTGDLLISIYPLQSTVSCPADIVPQIAIDFDPSNVPLAQLSFNYSSMLANGILLSTVPQPVDFVFSNTPVASGLMIVPNNYYVVTAKRAGSDDTCEIQFAVGSNSSTITRETIFNGNVWVDIPGQSLWFQVWTDAAKVSDGQAYDSGNGVLVPKTKINPLTALTQNYVLNQIPFVRNDLFYGLLQATTQKSVPVQDERTGNNIDSQQQLVPTITLLNTNGLSNIQNVSDPLILGTIKDQNVKVYSFATATSTAAFHEYGLVENQVVIKVITDTTDGYRYDQNIIELVSELVAGNLNGAQFTPNLANPSVFYRIANAELITMLYGDVDGNGIIDDNDILLANQLINQNLNIIPTHNQYIVNTSLFASDIHVSWQILNGITVVASGTDGIITANPNNGAIANFNSVSGNFNSIINIGGDTIVLSNSTAAAGNNGSFTIESLIDNNNITIQKTYYNSDTILQIMRGNITGNMVLSSTDISYITDYVEAVAPFPATTSPANNVGKTFNAIRFTLEEYVDREDDYPSTNANRSTTLHPLPDIFLDGYALFAGVDLELNSIQFNVVQQLVWNDYEVLTNSNPRLLTCSFNYQSGYTNPNCGIAGITTATSYPMAPSFDPGRNDFFIPDNLIVNTGGQFIRPDGYFMKMDFEIGTVTIEVPPVSFDMEHNVNLLTDFVADFSGTGYTNLGYPAMKFADCTNVTLDALVLNQIRFGVAVQSFSPQLTGLDGYCLAGVIVDGKIGVSVDYSTGLLTLNFTNLYQDPVLQTLNTKVEVTAYLKKAGWVNQNIFVDSTKAQNIFSVPTPTLSTTVCANPSLVVII